MEAEGDSTEGDSTAEDFAEGVGASGFMGRTVIPTIPSAMTITIMVAR